MENDQTIYEMAAREFRRILMTGRAVEAADVKRVYFKALVMDKRGQWRNPKNAA